MWKTYLNISIAVCVFIMTLTGQAGAVTRYVSPGQSIQAAIDASSNGDQIEVAPVTYNEAIDFKGKAVRLYSSGGPAVTTINGTGHSHVVQCVSGEDANTILEGFTITGGKANGPEDIDKYGGGMMNFFSSPTVTNCTFSNNTAKCNGGGMCNHKCRPRVTNCTFTSNSTHDGANGANGGWETGHNGGDGGYSGHGGGMDNYFSNPTVTNCEFSKNRTGNGGHGGDGADGVLSSGFGGTGGNAGYGAGMYNDCYSNPTVINCTFNENTSGNGGNGGEGGHSAFSEDSGPGGNGGDGAAMHNCNNSSPVVSNSIFSNNITGAGGKGGDGPGDGGNGEEAGDGGNGAGMCNRDNSSPIVNDCIFVENQTGNGGESGTKMPCPVGGCPDLGGGRGGHGAGMYNDDHCSPTLSSCEFAGNVTGDGGTGHYGTRNGSAGGNGGDGAGMYNATSSSPGVSNCLFNGNRTGNGNNGGKGSDAGGGDGGDGGDGGYGAGMYNAGDSSPTLNACAFTENVTGNGGNGGEGGDDDTQLGGDGGDGGNGGVGAGMCNIACSSTLNNCTFIKNVTGSGGTRGGRGWGLWGYGSYGEWGAAGAGVMSNFYSPAKVTNCSFYNSSSDLGCTMWNMNGSAIVTNCIVWGVASMEMLNVFGTLVVTYSDVKGGTGESWFGEGCIDADPCFVDSLSGNLRLRPDSPCIDRGSNEGVPAGITTDLDARLRIIDGDCNDLATVDMGAYEYSVNFLVHNVSQDRLYYYIQAAIDDANDGDQIEVAPATYGEHIDFKGKAVRLYSSGGPEVTAIDGGGNYHVVQCASGEDANTVLEGFTITGGNADGASWPDFVGGGMYCENSGPMVTNCYFIVNRSGYGAGMYNNNSSPIINNCSFMNNNAIDYGGGMDNYDGSNPTVTDCIFNGNNAGTEGGGMCNETSSPTVANCTFIGNKVNSYGGAVLNDSGSNTSFANCIFTGNVSGAYGGGIHNYRSSPTLTNCTFSNNSGTINGGGMTNYDSCWPEVTNCILWGNTPDQICDWAGTNCSTTVTYCDIQGGWGGTGNISADPCFVDAPAGNLRPRPGSQCIDKGSNAAVPSGITNDLDGRPRIIDGDCNDLAVVDMGAYEFNYAYMGDLDYDCGVDFGDFAIIGRVWLTEEGDADYDRTRNISVPPDKYIDWRDLAVIAENWLATPQ